MADSVLRDKSRVYAKEIVFLCRKLKAQKAEGIIVSQLLRCSTSIGANIHEAQYAQGAKDFISKLEIALKECNESEYWLGLLLDVEIITQDVFSVFHTKCVELRKILVASVNTMKQKNP